ncbi:hypothetical protein BD770DRAFT_473924 [Pilaira anomala]|nr:hypothetical protein BD770DRAFT_473924 [Pilaira anomala]
MNRDTAIILLDSDDEETELTTPRRPIRSSRPVYIELSDDESVCEEVITPYINTEDVLTTELEYILGGPLRPRPKPDTLHNTPNRSFEPFISAGTEDPLTAELEYILQAPLRPQQNSRPLHVPDRSISIESSPPASLPRQSKRPSMDTLSPQRKKKKAVVDSPFNRRPELKKKPKIDYTEREKEQELEEALERLVSVVSSTRFKEKKRDDTQRISCSVCHSSLPLSSLSNHSIMCNPENHRRMARKRTIADAVAMDIDERERRNKGKADTAPTNYYGMTDDVFATDGSGFNEDASGATWEYAGQTRF